MANTERPVIRLDPRSLRALAHPLRMRLIGSLREYGPATASQLAARLGESSGATSYHLRQLAEHGFIEDDPERGTGRERWWKSVHEGTQVESVDRFLTHEDPEVRGAMEMLMHEMAAQHALELSTFLGAFREWPVEWRAASEFSDYHLSLTPGQAREMATRIHEVIEGYRERGPEEGEAATVRVHLHAFPRPPEATA